MTMVSIKTGDKLYKLTVQYQGWGESWPLGTLISDRKQTLFEYSNEALAHGLEFSPRHLPLSSQTFSFKDQPFQLAGLFADSLPDGWGMLLIDRYFKRYHNRESHLIHPLERLAFLGQHTMGALTYQPSMGLDSNLIDLNMVDLAKAIVNVQQDRDTVILKELALMGGSPQGARPKALVYYSPTTKAMSTHPFVGSEPWLVKFPGQNEHEEVSALEAAYLHVAQLCNLVVPENHFFSINNKLSALLIRRFDRYGETRVPMHSLAGVLHANFRVPDCSYSTFLRTTRFLTKSEVEVQNAFIRCVFNVCMNNRDDHTKNFSYLMDSRGNWTLSPAYDLTFNTGINGHHQMDVEGESRQPTRQHIIDLALNSGLTQRFAQHTIDRIINIIHDQIGLFLNYPVRRNTAKRISAIIKKNSYLLS